MSKIHHSKQELMEAAKLITKHRREGYSIEEVSILLAAAGFNEKEIEKILEESDKLLH
jgi:DNA-binding transcriptional MerR regulator